MAVVLAGALVVVVWRGFAGSVGRLREARRTALAATALFSAAIAVGVFVRSVVDGADTTQAVPLLYQASLCCVALVLTAGLPGADSSSVVDLVVELGDSRSGTLRDAMAETLGDPTLEVGYWDGRARYLDAEGRVVEIARAGGTRSATFVEHESQPFAVLVHDPAILGEPALVESVAAATQLSTAHVELQNVVRDQLADLSASRRRLIATADEERQRLEVRLRDGAERHLREIDEELGRVTNGVAGNLVRVERAKLLLARDHRGPRRTGRGVAPPRARPRPRSGTPIAGCSQPGAGRPCGARRRPGDRGPDGRLLRVLRGTGQHDQARRSHGRVDPGHDL